MDETSCADATPVVLPAGWDLGGATHYDVAKYAVADFWCRWHLHLKSLRRFALLLILAGCVAPTTVTPSPGYDYGEAPDFETAQQEAHRVMQDLLKDPMSAQWECFPMRQGQMGDSKAFGSALSGWMMGCKINAKNSYGAYAGAVPYVFLFQGSSLRRVAEIGQSMVGETQRIVYDR